MHGVAGGAGWAEEDEWGAGDVVGELEGGRGEDGGAYVIGLARGGADEVQAFEGTIKTTHELLDLYVRLSSQAEHTQNLLLDRQWEGVTKVRLPSPLPPRLLSLASLSPLYSRSPTISNPSRRTFNFSQRAKPNKLVSPWNANHNSGKKPPPPLCASQQNATRTRVEVAPPSFLFARANSTTAAAPTRGAPRGRASTRGAGSSFSSSNASGIGRGGPPSASARGSVTGVRGVRGIRSRVLRGGTSAGRGRGGE